MTVPSTNIKKPRAHYRRRTTIFDPHAVIVSSYPTWKQIERNPESIIWKQDPAEEEGKLISTIVHVRKKNDEWQVAVGTTPMKEAYYIPTKDKAEALKTANHFLMLAIDRHKERLTKSKDIRLFPSNYRNPIEHYKKMDTIWKKDIIKAHRLGASLKQLSIQYNVGIETIRVRLIRWGYLNKPFVKKLISKHRREIAINKMEIIRLYCLGIGLGNISNKLNIPREEISEYLKQIGVYQPKFQRRKKLCEKYYGGKHL